MSTKENQNDEYINDDVTDVVIECEYVYEQGSIDDGTYVYEEESKKPSTTNSSFPKQKPGHKRGEAGVYDEIDYQLDPPIQDAQKISSNETVPTDTSKTEGKTKTNKIIIAVVIGCLLIGAIIGGIDFALPG